MAFFVYILASRRNGTLYIGMTDELGRRLIEHREGTFSGFTKRYGVTTLVWFEVFASRDEALNRPGFAGGNFV